MIWLSIIMVVAVTVFVLPTVIKQQIESRGSVSLGQPISIGYFGINPFVGRVEIRDVAIGEKTTLASGVVELNVLPLLKRRIELTHVDVSGVVLPVVISDSETKIAGVPMPASNSDSEPLDLYLEHLELENIQVELTVFSQSQAIVLEAVQVNQFNLKDFSGAQVDFTGSLNGSPLTVQGALKQLGFAGTVAFQNVEMSLLTRDQYKGVLSLDQQVDVEFESGAASGSLAGSIKVTDAKTPFGEVGSVQVDGTTAVTAQQLDFDGTVVAADIALQQLNAKRLQHTGKATVQTTDFRLSLSHSIQLEQGELVLPDGSVAFDSVNWNGTSEFQNLASYRVNGSADMSGITAMSFGRIEALDITDLDLVPNGLKLDQLVVTNTNLKLRKNRQGVWVGLPSTSQPSDVEREPFSLFVRDTQVRSSQFEFFDESIEPLVDIEMHNIEATLTDLSLQSPFKFEVSADHQVEKGLESHLIVEGDYDVAAAKGNIKAELANFELHEIAPYLGNGIRSGRLHLDSRVTLNPNHLKAENDVRITRVKVDETAGAGGDQMSLSTALFLLKDKQDVVELKVPLETDFKNVDVDFDDILQTAMLKAARTTAVTYAQYALQPYGSLLLARDVLGAITRPRFEPITFEQGSAELHEDSLGYVTKLGELLINKPDLTITVCGFASREETPLPMTRRSENGPEAEQTVVAERSEEQKIAALKELARQRSQLIRDQLHELGIDRERLYGCTATVEANNNEPRVELAL